MFMQRFITTLILVPLILGVLLYASPWFLGAILLLVFVAITKEYEQLIPLNTKASKAGYFILIFLALGLCHYLFFSWLHIGLAVWAILCVAISTFPKSQAYWGYPQVVAGIGVLLFPLFTECLIHLYFLPSGKSLLIYFLFLIWAADIGAYISGKFWGKHRLIPKVSPGKSWEGVGGGYFLALVITSLGWFYFKPVSLLFWIGLGVGTIGISIYGDLFISMLKRRCQLKDTGTLIPGHGGFLDRLDSLIAALPVFYYGLMLT